MRTRAGATVALVLSLTLLVPILGASAEEVVRNDPTGDTSSRSDIKWVEVTHSRADNLFRVRVKVDQVQIGASLVVYVDRRLNNPGPELRMVAYADSEWVMYRVNRWGERGQLVNSCGAVSYSTSTARSIASWRATRSCLNLDRKVRVAVRVKDDGHGVDWAPRRDAFFPPVAASANATPASV